MRRASYRHAVAWIAENEESGSPDALRYEVVAQDVCVVLIADLFGVAPERVGRDVVAYRRRLNVREIDLR